MINSLKVATDGYLKKGKNFLLGIAVAGYVLGGTTKAVADDCRYPLKVATDGYLNKGKNKSLVIAVAGYLGCKIIDGGGGGSDGGGGGLGGGGDSGSGGYISDIANYDELSRRILKEDDDIEVIIRCFVHAEN